MTFFFSQYRLSLQKITLLKEVLRVLSGLLPFLAFPCLFCLPSCLPLSHFIIYIVLVQANILCSENCKCLVSIFHSLLMCVCVCVCVNAQASKINISKLCTIFFKSYHTTISQDCKNFDGSKERASLEVTEILIIFKLLKSLNLSISQSLNLSQIRLEVILRWHK